MEIPFSKYVGSGNDFILLDNRENKIMLSPSQIKALCDRRLGIGGDGIIFMETGEKHKLKMRIFNSDGSEAEMCGNGLRCFSKFMEEQSLSFPEIESKMGVHRLEKRGLQVRASMTEPTGLKQGIKLSDSLWVDYLDTGVPHAVLFVEDVLKVDVAKLGSYIRHHEAFKPRGANANFVQILKPGQIRIRTFERGVEGETLACGTGATAAAILYAIRENWTKEVEVIPQSQESLIIEFQQAGNRIHDVNQTGPARFIFHGSFHLKDRYAAEDYSKKTSF